MSEEPVAETTSAGDDRPTDHASRRHHTTERAIRTTFGALDDRLRLASFGQSFLDHIFPDNWSFLLGEVALYAFVVLVFTGIFLTLYYVPSGQTVVYHGSYRPIDGAKVSQAYASTMNLSFDVRSGLLFRQMHHWAADIFIGAIVVHVARLYFTSAYRKPRDVNWIIGVTMLMLAIVNGFFGYSLPNDLLSGNGVRIMASIILSIPFVGSYLMVFFFQGNYPGTGIDLERMYILHVLIVPLLIIGLLGAHLALVFRQGHTQFPGSHRTERNEVGTPLFPAFAARTTGLLLLVGGTIGLLGGLAQIDPIWQIGPYTTYDASQAAQPDWYMGWIDGALRLFPSWEATFLGHTIPLMVFVPAVLMPVCTFGFLYLWPMIERRLTHDPSRHHLLTRARDRPVHTAFGVMVFTFYFLLLVASGTDVIAHTLGVPLRALTVGLRVLVCSLPLVTGVVAFFVCRELSGRTRAATEVSLRFEDGVYVETEVAGSDGHEELAPIAPPDHVVATNGGRVADPAHDPDPSRQDKPVTQQS